MSQGEHLAVRPFFSMAPPWLLDEALFGVIALTFEEMFGDYAYVTGFLCNNEGRETERSRSRFRRSGWNAE